MTARRRACLAVAALLAVVDVAAAVLVLAHADRPGLAVAFVVGSLWLGLALGGVGALVLALRRGNLLGPVLLAAGGVLSAEYALRSVAQLAFPEAGWAAAATWVGLSLDPVFFPTTLLLVLLLYPDGRLPTRGWRLLLLGIVVLTGVHVLLVAARPGPLRDLSFGVDVPWTGLLPASSADGVQRASAVIAQVLVLLLPVCAVHPVRRFRGTRGTTRLQYTPLLLVVALAVTGLLVQALPALRELGVVLLVTGVAVGLPAALAVAALRYRLWDLDRAVVATLVFLGLALLIAAVYVGVLAGVLALTGGSLPTSSIGPSIVAAAAIAVLAGYARDRVTRAARRLVYGVRASPYRALAALPQRLATVPEVDEVLPQIASALTDGLAVPAARVRAFTPDGVLEAWAGDAREDPLITLPVTHLGSQVGDVAVLASADRTLGPADRSLLADLADQAGPALRGVALTAELRAQLDRITAQADELRASRQRIVTAQLVERRRLERDLHDGAQQPLAVLAAHLGVAVELAGRGDPGLSAALQTCREDLQRSIDAVRELARGVYPPVLAVQGLVPAIRARARAASPPVRVEASGATQAARLPTELETAAYFCCLEALQNATRHAPGSQVTVRIDLDGEALVLEVADDGPGFDPDADGEGTGLVGMADRIGAVGGEVSVHSEPGRGTTVRAVIPR